MKYDKFLKVREINKKIIVPAFHRAGLTKQAYQIDDCGDFSVMYECLSCHTKEWKGFSRCKNKFCIACNTVKSLSWLARTYDKFANFLKEGKYITMLTLTIKDRKNLADALDILNNAWRFFTNRDRASSKEFKWKFIGGIKSLEVKTGKNSGEWHPHLHCLLIKDRFTYDKAFIDYAWSKCVKLAGGEDNEGITHIESIYIKDINGKKSFNNEALMKGIVESVKYISKFDYANESVDRLQELVKALEGVRQIDTFGCCKNIHKEVEKDIAADDELEKIVEHTCQLCGCSEAKLVNMITDDIDSSDSPILTHKVNISESFKDDMLDELKRANGVYVPAKEEIDKLEDLFYQASMFNNLGGK